MTGLREKQKADRDKRILRAAVTRFRAGGYRTVRIEDIAEAAEVSVGTVYNYYQTKGDILIATVALEVTEVLEAGRALVADPPPGVEDALLGLIYTYYDHSLEYLTKEMWRHAMGLSIEAPQTPSGQRYIELDGQLAGQVATLVARLQKRGDVLVELDADAMGELVFNALNMAFIEFVRDDAMTLGVLRARIARQVRPLARLMATHRETGA